jgi:serine-type D-Ala-D-Ala carboxypeptidase/endopeptidase
LVNHLRFLCCAVLAAAFSASAVAEDFQAAIQAYLNEHFDADKVNGGVVVVIVDDEGSRGAIRGKLRAGSDQEVNPDTLFEIGSITKTFTALLLADMVERGQMKLDDPVAKYLPKSVKMPTRNGKQITLRHLATHTSGLPRLPDNLEPKRADNPFAGYTAEMLYAFLSGYQLPRDPGASLEYSDTGMSLLGHVIALRAGASYEALIQERICRPLDMSSTRFMLSPELKARAAQGFGAAGYPLPSFEFDVMASCGAVRTTADDMIKYIAAQVGLTQSSLAPAMERTHAVQFPSTDGYEVGLGWFVAPQRQGTRIIMHNGATYGSVAFAGFDKARRRGVVILSNSRGTLDVTGLGLFLLESEWDSQWRPTETRISSRIFNSPVGEYECWSNSASPRVFSSGIRTAIGISSGCCVAVLAYLFWRADSLRRRAMWLAGIVLLGTGLGLLFGLPQWHGQGGRLRSSVGIFRDGGRIYAQLVGRREWPADAVIPPDGGELLPKSDNDFFERLSGKQVSFSRDASGEVVGLTLHNGGGTVSYERISKQPPAPLEPIKRHEIVKLDPKLLDAFVGDYEFALNGMPAEMKMKVWREGEQLMGRASGGNAMRGPFEIHPESETTFFLKIDGAQLIFTKDDKGEVTGVVLHAIGQPDMHGRRVKAVSNG